MATTPSGTRSPGIEFNKDAKPGLDALSHHGHIHRRIGSHFHRPHIFHPDGRKIHIAHNPAHAEDLRRQISREQTGEIDLVIHGTQEHIDALREIYLMHEDRQSRLKDQHGDLFHEIEGVVAELDHISAELSAMTESVVKLDANFSKYGYDAHIRTHDRDSPNQSSNNSLFGDRRSSQSDWDASKHQGAHMRFYIKPIVRQYFHKGILWRAQENEEVMPYELFFDLIYVGIIAITGDSTADDANGHSLLRFAITFIMSWKVWSDVTVIISWFDANDMVRRVYIVFMLATLVGLTSNVMEFYNEAYTPLVGFYLAGRLGSATHLLWIGYLLPMIRTAMLAQVSMVVIPAALWIASIHVPEYGRQALIWPAICLDLFGMIIFWGVLNGEIFSKPLAVKVRSRVEFMPALNIEHRIERTGAFVTLVFGYSVVSLLYQSRSNIGINAFFGKAILGMVQAFSFNWLYFEIDQFNIHTHAIRRSALTSMMWFSMHLPFIMAFVLAGAALSRIVLTHDAPATNTDDLAEYSLTRSEAELTAGQRWFYCAGLGVALLCMNLISLCHSYKSPEKGYRIHKHGRLGLRFAIGAVFVALGAARDLDSVQLIATTTGLTVFALGCELWGHGVRGECWRMRERRCKYSARCNISRKQLEASVKSGAVLNVEELGGEKGSWDTSI